MGPLGLRWRFLLYVLLPLIVFSGVLGYVALRQFEKLVRERMELDVQVVARTFQPALGRLLTDENPASLQPLLRQAFEAEGDYGVFVYDLQGNMIARAGHFQNTDSDLPALSGGGPAGRASRGGAYSRVADESVYSYFAPLVTERGELRGLLQVARLRRDYDRFLSNLRLGVLSFFILGTVSLVGVVALGYQKAIGASLERLNASMRAVKRGDRNHRAAPRGPKEVVGLGETLNDMLNSIQRAEDEILSQKEKEQRLAERLRQSEKLASLGNISAGVAHELGTPLSVVGGNAQRALRQENNPPKTEAALHGIREEVERMDRIVRQLLEFGRAGESESRLVTPEKLARAALSGVESVRAETGAEIVLGETCNEGQSVRVNPVRVELALINLLKNALQVSPNGRVRFSWTASPESVIFEVADSGPGIDRETARSIFEPFFSTKGPNQGVGLGLAIVSQVADECGGRVRVDSEPGQGARFFFTVPFAAEDP